MICAVGVAADNAHLNRGNPETEPHHSTATEGMRFFSLEGVMMSRRKQERHGGTGTRLYHIWRGMLQRCYCRSNKQWPDYGGRGIAICDEWVNSFAAFRDWANAHGYSDSLTIDRQDNNGDYCHVNCRWTTAKVQCNNRRQFRLPNKASIYTGVVWHKKCGKWQCSVKGRPNGGKVHCGLFATEIEAALHYNSICETEIPERTFRNVIVETDQPS